MGQGIIKIFFIIFLGVSILPTALHAAPKSLETCLNEISPGQPDAAIDKLRRACYLNDVRNGLKLKSEPSKVDLIRSSFTLDFGLGEPVFSGLKRKRDEFIYNYLDKNISKVKKIQRENIRRFNLKSLMSGGNDENGIISKLKKIFNLTSIEGILAEFKQKRLDKCEKSSESKMENECEKIEDPYIRQQCENEAQSILDNCFKYSTESTALKKLQDKLRIMEDEILESVAKMSLVNHDAFDGTVASIMSKASGIDGSFSAINRATNLEFSGKLGDLLDGDATYTIEKMIAEKAGISMEFVGPNSWKNENKQDDFLNYRLSVSSTRINNICDLTKCLVYPSSKRYTVDSNGETVATSEYQSMCLDANLTEEYLNELVNEARKKLTKIMSQLVLKEIMVRVGVDAYLDDAKNALICGQAATSKAISDEMKDLFGTGDDFDLAGALSEAIDSGAPAEKVFAEKANKCLAKHTEKLKKIHENEFGLIKCGGPIGHIYVASGAANIPYGCVKLQGKISAGNTLLIDPKDKAAISACMAEGETADWEKNYHACIAADGAFKFGSGFGGDLFGEIGDLFNNMDIAAVFQCEGLLSPDRRSSYGSVLNIKLNPLMAESASDADAMFMAVKSKLIHASKVLFRGKVDASIYLPTENMLCANRAFEVLKRNAYYTDFDECEVLDHELDDSLLKEKVPKMETKNLLSGYQIPETASKPPINLLPSVIDLCTRSADYVIKNLKNEYPIGDKTDVTSPSDPRSPGSPISEDPPVISKAISNVNKCSMFFNDMELVLPRADISLDNIVQKQRFGDWVSKQTQTTSYIDGIIMNDSLFQYKSTIEMLIRRSESEKFNICIKNNDNDWIDKPTLIRKARKDYCKDYRISLFDRYYDSAATAFNYPITDDQSRIKVDKYIDAQTRKYEEGTW